MSILPRVAYTLYYVLYFGCYTVSYFLWSLFTSGIKLLNYAGQVLEINDGQSVVEGH